jgi:hypothetical protein
MTDHLMNMEEGIFQVCTEIEKMLWVTNDIAYASK